MTFVVDGELLKYCEMHTHSEAAKIPEEKIEMVTDALEQCSAVFSKWLPELTHIYVFCAHAPDAFFLETPVGFVLCMSEATASKGFLDVRIFINSCLEELLMYGGENEYDISEAEGSA